MSSASGKEDALLDGGIALALGDSSRDFTPPRGFPGWVVVS